MAYADLTTAEKIQAFYQSVVFSASTKPSLTEVNEWIGQATQLIYGALEMVYSVPEGGITDAEDLKQLTFLANLYVREEVDFVVHRSRRSFSEGNVTYPQSVNHKKFFKVIDMYKKSLIKLKNTPNNASDLQTNSYNAKNEIEAEAQKGVDQW